MECLTENLDLSDDEIVERMEENGVPTTENPNEAIYILRDGRMLSGNFTGGSRTEDHRCIESCFDTIDRYTENFFSIVHTKLGVVQVSPESNYLLIMQNQKLTEEQKMRLEFDYNDYTLDIAFPELKHEENERNS